MELFLQIATTFPTAVFSVLLIAALGYWLLAMLGLIDLDVFDASGHHHGAVDPGGLAGLLLKFGLDGVPLTLIVTTIALIAWMLSYFADYFLLRHLPFDATRWLFGSGIVLGAPLVATPFAGLVLRPFGKMFGKLKSVDSASLLGQVCVIRSPEVTPNQGQAIVDDGGAGLILQVRADAGQFRRGERAVLVEYLAAQNAYRIIKES